MNGWFLVGKLVGKYTSAMDSIECHDPFFKSYRKKNQSGQSNKVQLCVSDSVVSIKKVLGWNHQLECLDSFPHTLFGKDNNFLANSAGKLEAFQLNFLFFGTQHVEFCSKWVGQPPPSYMVDFASFLYILL